MAIHGVLSQPEHEFFSWDGFGPKMFFSLTDNRTCFLVYELRHAHSSLLGNAQGSWLI